MGSDSEGEDGRESKGKMEQRHKKELKELAKVQEKELHSVSKADKKAKKELEDKHDKQTKVLKDKHKAEKEALDSAVPASASDAAPSSSGGAAASGSQASEIPAAGLYVPEASRIGKTQEKKAKKEAKEKEEQEARRAEALAEAASLPDRNKAEQERLTTQLAPQELVIREVAADGHCLFRAVAGQLPEGSVAQMRTKAGEYIRSHFDDYAAFLIGENDDDVIPDADSYCKRMIQTAAWGGEPEISALSNALQRQIVIFTADGPPRVIGEQFSPENPIRLSFHKHSFSLGAHYNAVLGLQQLDSFRTVQ